MKNFLKKILKWFIKKFIINWKHPLYSKTLFELSSKYVDFWYGDNNFDRKTNGEYYILKLIMPTAKTVFDVGANIGEYSSEILNINPKINIHAFEPGNIAFSKLKLLKVNANNFALGDKEGTQILFQDPKYSTHNSLYKLDNNSKPVYISVKTLDDYCLEKNITHIDFLKIDVEGYEYNVLLGSQKMISKQAIDYVQFEFSGATIESRVFLKDFLEFFKENNYTLYRIKPKKIEPVDYRPDRERFTLTNYLAIKNEINIPKNLT